MKIFSTKQINATAIIAGPLPAAYLLARNYLNSKQKRISLFTLLPGYFLAILVYALTILLGETYVIRTGIFSANKLFGYCLIILLYFGLQLIVALVFLPRIAKSNNHIINKFALEKDNIYSFVNLIPFILLGIGITTFLFIIGPFRFIFFVIYVLPNIYLYSHLKQVFVSKQNKRIFTYIFIVLVAIFPITHLFHHHPSNAIVHYSLLLGYYYLPILLYSFLLYIFFDVILLFNRKTKFISADTIVSQRFRTMIFGVIIFITLATMVSGIYNFNNTKIRKYTIEVLKESGKIEHLKIAMAADFHFGELTNKYFMTQFIDKINAINPDIVLLAGDIVEAEQSSSKMEFFEAQLREIKTKFGVYAIEGNHDIYSRKNSYNFLENANVKILRDTVIKIENSFYLIGRKDRHSSNRQSIPDLLKNTCDSLPVFLLDHQPYNLENTYNNDVNIQFSGHTHHGQLFPLNFITEKIYELSWGYRKIQNTHFFVTCGAQGWGPQVKTASQSEIIEVVINFY